MYHKNLEYIRSAKWLNTRQSKWALFFNRFNFTLFYHPVSKIQYKPDAHFHLLDPDSSPKSPSTILPTSCVVGVDVWGIEKKVKNALVHVVVAKECPPNRLFGVSYGPRLFTGTTHAALPATLLTAEPSSCCWPAMEKEVG